MKQKTRLSDAGRKDFFERCSATETTPNGAAYVQACTRQTQMNMRNKRTLIIESNMQVFNKAH